MKESYTWLTKRSKRVVNNLKLWGANPRLANGGNCHKTIDFANELISDSAEKQAFLKLARSIATKGYIPAEPIVVWQELNNPKFYVAEGNRRVLAMKLLINPDLAPKEIKATFKKLAKNVDRGEFRQIPVAIAPTFEDAEWYISQRHFKAGTHKRWEPEQQYRWVADLFQRYSGDFNKIRRQTQLSEGEINKTLAVLAFKSSVFPKLKGVLSDEVYADAISPRFYLSTLERLLFNQEFQKHLALSYDQTKLTINGDENEFLSAISEVVRRMYLGNKDPERIDSRTINDSKLIGELINKIPKVSLRKVSEQEEGGKTSSVPTSNEAGGKTTNAEAKQEEQEAKTKAATKNNASTSAGKNKLIPTSVQWSTNVLRINKILRELQEINIDKQFNAAAVLFRSYLDMVVYQFIKKNGAELEMLKESQQALDQDKALRRVRIVKYLDSLGVAEDSIHDTALWKAVGGSFKASRDRVPTLREMLVHISKSDTLISDSKLKQALGSYVNGNRDFLDHNDFNLLVHNEYVLKTGQDLKNAWDQLFPILDFMNQQLGQP